jgi:UDP-glucose 4-epimerase
MGAQVVVIDDFSSGSAENLAQANLSGHMEVRHCDLGERSAAEDAIDQADIVFHLAAIHGGRGFIEAFPEKMLVNFSIDQNVVSCAAAAGVKTLVHASSACAYPVNLQLESDGRSLLAEEMAGFSSSDQSFPDGTYGWIKLMGEYQVKIAAEAGRFRGRSARIFTAYGERENESHAAIALIAKALMRIDPFPVWGTGLQTRNFTYVEDTVNGLLCLGADQSRSPYDVFNVGSRRHHTVLEFLDEVFSQVGWRPSEFDFQDQYPTGVGNRAADVSKFVDAFGWEPDPQLAHGVGKTVAWYRELPSRPQTAAELESLLLSR